MGQEHGIEVLGGIERHQIGEHGIHSSREGFAGQHKSTVGTVSLDQCVSSPNGWLSWHCQGPTLFQAHIQYDYQHLPVIMNVNNGAPKYVFLSYSKSSWPAGSSHVHSSRAGARGC